MVAIQEIKSFGVIPWKSLRFGEPQSLDKIIGQSNGASIKVDCIPSLVCERLVGAIVTTEVYEFGRSVPRQLGFYFWRSEKATLQSQEF